MPAPSPDPREPPRPEVSVVIPSHERPTRLRWLLNALEEQTLAPERFEVIVAHDCAGETTETLLRDHPLAQAGRLRHLRFTPGTGRPSVMRNAGWRAAHAPRIAFTDDDCRPDPAWLEGLLAAAREAPDAIVQGTTEPDPFEAAIWQAAHVRSLAITPPDWIAQTCNILYPVTVLERFGGFDEAFPGAAGEDTDLALRARAHGVELKAAEAATVFHAVEAFSLAGMVQRNLRWRHLVRVVRLHPELRGELTLRYFWRRQHLTLLLAAAGLIGTRRVPLLALLAAPYLRGALRARGPHTGRLAGTAQIPARVVIDGAEVATMAWGSVTHRTLLL